ncbi:MAG: 50S ribosomal protein L9 [bacterium]|nr:50S ribosomal protein L9 [bacterium]
MQVILRETLDNLGEAGSVVNVKDGYARNYLFPRNLAAPATLGTKRHLEHIRRLAEKKRLTELKTAESVRDRLEQTQIEITARAGEKDKLYGSVTTAQIAEALEAQGIKLDRRKIVLEHPIRELGMHAVKVRVDPRVSASLKVNVSPSADSVQEPALFSEPAPMVEESTEAPESTEEQ